MKYQIIYLNGPSSVGKTTLAKALQKVLEPPFLHIGIDKIIGMMPERLNNWVGGEAPQGFSWKSGIDADGKPMQELQVGPIARKVSDSYPEIVALLAQRGHSLIVDDVGISDEEFKKWQTLFQKYKTLYVALKASLPALEQRERQRGDRIIGSARVFHHKMKFGNQYDLELDTSELSIDQCVEMILKKDADAKN